MTVNAAAEALLEGAHAYHVIVAKATGSVNLAVLWGQIHYWTNKTKDPDGWIYKTGEEIYNETALTRRQLETAREIGETSGVLETILRGTPPITHYRVRVDRMLEVIEVFLSKQKQPAKPVPKARAAKLENSIDWVRQLSDQSVQEIASSLNVSTSTVKKVADDLLNYCAAHGRTYKDYKAALRNFINKHVERYPDARVSRSAPAQIADAAPIEQPKQTEEERQAGLAKLAEMRADFARKKERLAQGMSMAK